MKIIHINTTTIAPGKQAEARALVAEVKEYFNKKEPEVSRTFAISVAGSNPRHIQTRITTWDSLAQWEKSMEQRGDDRELQAIVKKARSVFVPGSREFTIHEVL